MNTWTALIDPNSQTTATRAGAGLARLAEVLSLGPTAWIEGLVLLGFLCLLNDLVRTALMTERTRSVVVHVTVCTLTLAPAILLAGVLVWAGYSHPERVWLNLGFALLLYIPWWLGGALTRLVREDSEGADVGWMMMGALITFPAGLITAAAT